MKIFITGATGFIGTHLIRRLAQTDHEMLCLVRETSNVQELEKLGVTMVRGDVNNKDSLLAGMKGCDWVIHLANVYSFWEPDKKVFAEVNIKGHRKVMESALETGVSKVVHVSTIGIYGKPEESPFASTSRPSTKAISFHGSFSRIRDCPWWWCILRLSWDPVTPNLQDSSSKG